MNTLPRKYFVLDDPVDTWEGTTQRFFSQLIFFSLYDVTYNMYLADPPNYDIFGLARLKKKRRKYGAAREKVEERSERTESRGQDRRRGTTILTTRGNSRAGILVTRERTQEAFERQEDKGMPPGL